MDSYALFQAWEPEYVPNPEFLASVPDIQGERPFAGALIAAQTTLAVVFYAPWCRHCQTFLTEARRQVLRHPYNN